MSTDAKILTEPKIDSRPEQPYISTVPVSNFDRHILQCGAAPRETA
jgi:hypothetical protein